MVPLLVFLLVIVAACGGPTSTPTAAIAVVPLDVVSGAGAVEPPRGGCGSVTFADLRLQGDLAADPPIWAEVVGDGMRLRVRWPPGFVARFEPDLVIYDAHRRPVVRQGDVLTDASGYPAEAPRPITLLSFNGIHYPCG